MNVRHPYDVLTFSIKIIFYDKMNFMLFYFDATIYLYTLRVSHMIHNYINFSRVFESSFISVYILNWWERLKCCWSVLSLFSIREFAECLNFKCRCKQDVYIIWPTVWFKARIIIFDDVYRPSIEKLLPCDLTKHFFAPPKSLFKACKKDYVMI